MSGVKPFDVRRTQDFRLWLDDLRDAHARAIIDMRLQRVAKGNLGDYASVGGGVGELRVHFGPGYRVYFARRESRLILLLCGGDKASQARDIERAKAMVKEL